MTAERRREASDPTTPGGHQRARLAVEQMRALIRQSRQVVHRSHLTLDSAWKVQANHQQRKASLRRQQLNREQQRGRHAVRPSSWPAVLLRGAPPDLRQAHDPLTSSDQLRVLWARASDDEEVSRAVMTNPNLPLSLLRAFVTSGFETAWRNPSVPLLLLTDPSPEYEVAARRLLALASLEEGKYVRGNLAQLVAQWAPGPPGRARRLARQFALLFGLPWPSP